MRRADFGPFLSSLVEHYELWTQFAAMDKDDDDLFQPHEFIEARPIAPPPRRSGPKVTRSGGQGCAALHIGAHLGAGAAGATWALREFNRVDADGSGAIFFRRDLYLYPLVL